MSLANPTWSRFPSACSGLMNAGVPTAMPAIVSVEPLCDDGRSVTSSLQVALLVPADELRQAPVHHQGLAVLAHDHVGRLEVAVDHPAAVRVLDRVADVDEAPEELLEPEPRLAFAAAPARPRLAWNCRTASLKLSPLMKRIT